MRFKSLAKRKGKNKQILNKDGENINKIRFEIMRTNIINIVLANGLPATAATKARDRGGETATNHWISAFVFLNKKTRTTPLRKLVSKSTLRDGPAAGGVVERHLAAARRRLWTVLVVVEMVQCCVETAAISPESNASTTQTEHNYP